MRKFVLFSFLLFHAQICLAVEYQIFDSGVISNYPIQSDLLDDYHSKSLLKDQREHPSKRKQAIVVGAGITGLMSALVLEREGFEVVVLEKRKTFDRLNMVNLKVESESALQELNLLPEFQEAVASRLKEHRYFRMTQNEMSQINVEGVDHLRVPSKIHFKPEIADSFFTKDGLYTITIAKFQQFLATQAQKRGVFVMMGTDIQQEGMKNEIIRAKQGTQERVFTPDLIILSDGAKKEDQAIIEDHPCHKEKWVYGNVGYEGKEAFVVVLLNYSDKNSIQISNIIFNPKSKEANIAVTVNDDHLEKGKIKSVLESVTAQAFKAAKIDTLPKVKFLYPNVVTVRNRQAQEIALNSKTILAGDRAGVSSPLAGLGATLGTTVYPFGIQILARAIQSEIQIDIERAFQEYSKLTLAYTSRWVNLSKDTRTLINKTLNPNY